MKIFVYGSLKRGYRLHGYITGVKHKFLGEDRIEGVSLYQVAGVDWPGVVEGTKGTVHGEVYRVPRVFVEGILDLIEGVHHVPPLFKRITTVTHKFRHEVGMYVFAQRMPAGSKYIKGGVWNG